MKTLKFLPTSFCVLLFVFQACVGNKISSEGKSKIESVIVQTHDGYTYDLPWYEVKDENLVSILNTSRIVLDQKQVIEVAIDNPEPKKVNIHDALMHDGTISMIAYDAGQRVHNYKFYKLVEVRGQIVGYTYTGGYPADINIPLENVKNIDVQRDKQTNDTANRILGWTFIFALDCLATYHGYPGMFWLY